MEDQEQEIHERHEETPQKPQQALPICHHQEPELPVQTADQAKDQEYPPDNMHCELAVIQKRQNYHATTEFLFS